MPFPVSGSIRRTAGQNHRNQPASEDQPAPLQYGLLRTTRESLDGSRKPERERIPAGVGGEDPKGEQPDGSETQRLSKSKTSRRCLGPCFLGEPVLQIIPFLPRQ